MPFVRIMTGDRYSEMQQKQISDILHQALTETFAVPAQDRFHFLNASRPGIDTLIGTISARAERRGRYCLISLLVSRGALNRNLPSTTSWLRN